MLRNMQQKTACARVADLKALSTAEIYSKIPMDYVYKANDFKPVYIVNLFNDIIWQYIPLLIALYCTQFKLQFYQMCN